MWFGLLPGPFTVIRAFTPRRRRRTRTRRPVVVPTGDEGVYKSVILSLAAFGLMLVLIGMKNLPGLVAAGYVFIGMAVVARLVLFYISVTNGPAEPPHTPPAGPPRPYLPQPSPLPRPDQPLARSGHKPVNREVPADRPHPWRTWEG